MSHPTPERPTTRPPGLAGPRTIAAGSAVLTMLGILFALRADGEQRAMIVGGTVFFAGCLVAGLAELAGRPRALGVGCLVMGVGCALMALAGAGALTVLAWLGAIFFGLGGLALLVIGFLPPRAS